MTSRELQQIEEFANRSRPKEEAQLGSDSAALARHTVAQLDESVTCVENCLKGLALLFEEVPLPAALIGAIGYSALEMRQQLPALREAAKEAGK
jgi:hypothetical protein